MIKVTGYLLWATVLCLSVSLNCAHAADPQAIPDRPAAVSGVAMPLGQTGAAQQIPPQTISEVAGETTKETGTETSAEAPQSYSLSANPRVKSDRSREFASISAPQVGSSLIQVTFGLFVVLMVIAAAAWFTRRFGHFQATAGGSLRIIGGLHLGAKERLVVVQVGEEQLLLGVAPGRISKLHLLTKPLTMTHGESSRDGRGARPAPGSFRDYLTAVLKRDGK